MTRKKDVYIVGADQPVKPFLKWAGGKTQLIDEIAKFIPQEFNTYIEPFLGGGALFFHLRPPKAILADLNPELINCYKVVREKIDDLIVNLKNLSNDKDLYYEIRGWDLSKLSDVERAVRFIYLNRTCYNGPIVR
ncbi:DNA adenine methylase [Alistipes senegalensis]|uniref:DNA adenine methylase n=1 Tax=Alistipes senegalensis TaxID=1288121 RepID=UPI0034A54A76